MAAETEIMTVETFPSDSPILSDAVNAETLLKEEKAKQELQQLQLHNIADLIHGLEKIYSAKLVDLDMRINTLERLLKQALELHRLMIDDTKTMFEIASVFQSQLIVLDEVRTPGTIQALKTVAEE